MDGEQLGGVTEALDLLARSRHLSQDLAARFVAAAILPSRKKKELYFQTGQRAFKAAQEIQERHPDSELTHDFGKSGRYSVIANDYGDDKQVMLSREIPEELHEDIWSHYKNVMGPSTDRGAHTLHIPSYMPEQDVSLGQLLTMMDAHDTLQALLEASPPPAASATEAA